MKEELEKMATDIKAHVDKGIEAAKKESEATIKSLSDSLDAEKKESEKVKGEVIKLTETIAGMKEQGTSNPSMKQAIAKAFKDNEEAIKGAYKSGKTVELVIKAVGDMTTGSASNPGGIPELFPQQFAPAGNVNLRAQLIESLVTRFATGLAAFPYTETVPKDGVALVVGEGAAKPQIDFKIETRFSTPEKVAAWVRLTEESVMDIVGLQSIADNYLRDRVRLKKEKQILAKALATATTFTAENVPYANQIESPTLIDAINAMVTSIFTTHNYEDEMPYMASLAMVHPVDFFLQIVSAKDDNGLPLYPNASMFNRVQIGATTVIPYEDAQLTVGNVLVADMSKINIADYSPYTVRIGWVNDDFIKNEFVILGETRYHNYVKELDKIAFLKGDISTIIGNLAVA